MYWKILERGENGANSYFSRNRLQKLLPQIDQHLAWMPENSPPSGQAATCWKTKVIQSYLRIWGTYVLIGSDPSDPKKWGLYGCSVKNEDFQTENGSWQPPRCPPCNRFKTKTLPFWFPVMMVTRNFDDIAKNGFRAKNLHFFPKNHFFSMLHPYIPLILH